MFAPGVVRLHPPGGDSRRKARGYSEQELRGGTMNKFVLLSHGVPESKQEPHTQLLGTGFQVNCYILGLSGAGEYIHSQREKERERGREREKERGCEREKERERERERQRETDMPYLEFRRAPVSLPATDSLLFLNPDLLSEP